MNQFHDYIDEYKEQLKKGDIVKAYRGIIEYVMNLRVHFKNKYLEYFVSGSIYYGYMDMTYFSFTPKSLKDLSLKIGIVFIHDSFRFEIWLGGYNKKIQSKYWNLIKESNWDEYNVVSTTEGVDSIVEHILVDKPDFSNLEL